MPAVSLQTVESTHPNASLRPVGQHQGSNYLIMELQCYSCRCPTPGTMLQENDLTC